MNGKLLIIIIVATLVFTMPFAALGRMSSIADDDLDEVMGRTGISVNLTFHINDSYISWTDTDGHTDTGLSNQGVLSMTGFTIDSDGQGGDLTLVGLTIDSGVSSTGTSYLTVGLPNIDGYITCNSLKIGSVENSGGGMGHVVVGNLHTRNSAFKIRSHVNQ